MKKKIITISTISFFIIMYGIVFFSYKYDELLNNYYKCGSQEIIRLSKDYYFDLLELLTNNYQKKLSISSFANCINESGPEFIAFGSSADATIFSLYGSQFNNVKQFIAEGDKTIQHDTVSIIHGTHYNQKVLLFFFDVPDKNLNDRKIGTLYLALKKPVIDDLIQQYTHHIVSIIGMIILLAGMMFILHYHKTKFKDQISDEKTKSSLTETMPGSQNTALQQIPEHIGPYKVIKKIGSGGMADVFHVILDTNEKQYIDYPKNCALKISKKKSHETVMLFDREKIICNLVNDDNIVRTFNTLKLDGDGNEAILMEYIEGKNLQEIIESVTDENLPVDMVLYIMLKINNGLIHAHDKKVIHRDIKPKNILISFDGKIKIGDFGIAKRTSDQYDGETLIGHPRKGTEGYKSPEQISGNSNLDHRTDIYSFGIVFFELLTRQRYVKIMDKETQPVRFMRMRRDIPKKLEQIVVKCLKYDREERYSNATELRQEIELLQEQHSYTFGDINLKKFMKQLKDHN